MEEVGSGVVTGGWGYITASYVVVYVTLVGYAISLFRRRSKAEQDK